MSLIDREMIVEPADRIVHELLMEAAVDTLAENPVGMVDGQLVAYGLDEMVVESLTLVELVAEIAGKTVAETAVAEIVD